MTTIEILMLVSSMLGGLALFLSGMSTMSDSLAAMTGGCPAPLRKTNRQIRSSKGRD